MTRVPCLKQHTRCVIVRIDGRRYEATNTCDVNGQTTCPRVAASCPTGTGYELCGSIHAEAAAAVLAAESYDVPGEAFLYGHTWICKDCQDTLRMVNVNTFHVEAAR
jgi:deoxycytidylate deaminase